MTEYISDHEDFYNYDDDYEFYEDTYYFDELIEDAETKNQFPGSSVLIISVLIVGFLLFMYFANLGVVSTKAAELTDVGIVDTNNSSGESEIIGSANRAISAVFSPEVQHWEPQIKKWSQDFGLDANLIATIIQIESCGYPAARSHAGAAGLFQVMPFHFQAGEDSYDIDTNAYRGLTYLRQVFTTRDGNVRLTMAGYNGGIAGTSRPEGQWPNETRRYVYWGTGIYDDAVSGKATSPRLTEWLNSGGGSLCRKASEHLGASY
jgi:hypothetical protein